MANFNRPMHHTKGHEGLSRSRLALIAGLTGFVAMLGVPDDNRAVATPGIAIPADIGPDTQGQSSSAKRSVSTPTRLRTPTFSAFRELRDSTVVILGETELPGTKEKILTPICTGQRRSITDPTTGTKSNNIISTAEHCFSFLTDTNRQYVVGAQDATDLLEGRYFIAKPRDTNLTPLAELDRIAIFKDPFGVPIDSALFSVKPNPRTMRFYRTLRPSKFDFQDNEAKLPKKGEAVYMYGPHAANPNPVIGKGVYLGRATVSALNSSGRSMWHVDVVGVNAPPEKSGCYFQKSGSDAVTKRGYKLKTFSTRFSPKDAHFQAIFNATFDALSATQRKNAIAKDAKWRAVQKGMILRSLGINNPHKYESVCIYQTLLNQDVKLAEALRDQNVQKPAAPEPVLQPVG